MANYLMSCSGVPLALRLSSTVDLDISRIVVFGLRIVKIGSDQFTRWYPLGASLHRADEPDKYYLIVGEPTLANVLVLRSRDPIDVDDVICRGTYTCMGILSMMLWALTMKISTHCGYDYLGAVLEKLREYPQLIPPCDIDRIVQERGEAD